jgi:SARP family transcriptional regulator, regulator of embCAB operon
VTAADRATRDDPARELPPGFITVRLLGGVEVRRGDVVLGAHQLGGPKPRQILEILLLELGTPVSKDRLIELLWGGTPAPQAVSTLESYVSVLRRHLQPGLGRSGPLRTSTGGYVIDPALVELDLDRFDVAVRTAQGATTPQAYALLRSALELTGAPLLADELLPGWAQDARALHAIRVTAAQIQAAELATVLIRPHEAVDLAHLALASEPLNERAWTVLLVGLEQAGRHAEGLAAYEHCRRGLDRELGCAPGAALQAIYARLLRATADGDGELSEVLSALLVLLDQLNSAKVRPTTDGDASPAMSPTDSLRSAGNVVDSFIRRALAA